MSPHEGIAYDEPGPHPAEKAIRNAAIRKDPVGMMKKMFLPRKKKSRS